MINKKEIMKEKSGRSRVLIIGIISIMLGLFSASDSQGASAEIILNRLSERRFFK